MARRHYSDKDRADGLAVLEAHGGNVRGAARSAGVNESTMRLWNKDNQRAAPDDVRAESKKDLANELTKARWLYLDRLMDPKAVQTTSGYYAAVTFKVLNEAHQLLTGGPTARIEGNLADFLRTHSGTNTTPGVMPKAPFVPKQDKAEPRVTLSN